MLAPVGPHDRHLIALDLDGTVLEHGAHGVGEESESGRIDPDLSTAIRALHEAGHSVVIATGRSVDATLPVVEQLRIKPEWVIAANGAVTLKRDTLAPRAYRNEFVEAFDPTSALLKIRRQLMSARYAVELTTGGFLYTDDIPAGTLPAEQKRVPFEELLGVQATRVVVFSPDQRLEEFMDAVKLLGLTHVSYSVGTSSWLDIAPDGVTKASALELVASKLYIDRSRVFAAGDGRNDIDMLRWAAKRGDSVAMGQADADVIAAAGRVTGTIGEVGLLSALRERFPELLKLA